MAEEKQGLEGLKDAIEANAATAAVAAAPAAAESAEAETTAVVAEDKVLVEPVIDDLGRTYATGKRKNAIARVWLKPGNGTITVNGRELKTFFARPVLQMIINQPFSVADREGQYDVVCTVSGGGLSGQAGAVRHGLTKALVLREPILRGPLKKVGFLTRDSRVVERKKYGRAKARRSFQFSKR